MEKNQKPADTPKPDYEKILNGKALEYFGRKYLDRIQAMDTEMMKSVANSNMWPGRTYPLQEMVDPMQKKREEETGAAWKTKAKYIDPTYNLLSWTGARVKPSSISFQTLRLMSYKCIPVRAIINTRREQVPDVAWGIRLKNAEGKPTASEQERIDYITKLLEYPVNTSNRRISWTDFIKAFVEDGLALDAATFEVVRNRKGMIKELWNCDGATIRPNMNEYGEYDSQEAYIQEISGIKSAAFTYNELAYCVANPRSDIYSYGYGYSSLEALIEMVTAILFVDKYNRSYFSDNSIPQGVLSLVGDIDPQDLEMWRRYWTAEVKGIDNFWKMPIVNVPDESYMKWQKFKDSNSDMQYNIYYDWLIRLVCAVYQTDPSEINVHGQPGVGGLGQQGGAATVAKVEYSKSKGLRSILRHIKESINTHVIMPMWDDLTFMWTGIEAESRPEKIELRTKEINSGYKTINEFRKEDHLEPVPWGDIPANPTIANIYAQQQMMKMQQGQVENGSNGETGEAGEAGAGESIKNGDVVAPGQAQTGENGAEGEKIPEISLADRIKAQGIKTGQAKAESVVEKSLNDGIVEINIEI